MDRVAFVGFLLAIFSINGAFSTDYVPVYVWNVDTDVSVSPLKSADAKTLVEKLTPSLAGKLVVVFMQDELSVEDFKSGNLDALKTLAETSQEGTFYAPSLTDPENISKQLSEQGFKVIQVRSHEDLPTQNVQEQTALLIQLPSTSGVGVNHAESLQLNANVMTQIFEVLKTKQPDAVGLFTATKNTKIPVNPHANEVLQKLTRTRRAAPTPDSKELVNATSGDLQLMLLLERPPQLQVCIAKNWANFSMSNPTSTLSGTKMENMLQLTYTSAPVIPDGTLNKAVISINFTMGKNQYWKISGMNVDLDVKMKDGTVVTGEKVMNITDISTPKGFSYHCTPRMVLGKYGNKETEMVIFRTNGFQLQPFEIKRNMFGDWYDCQGFFTVGIWAAIFIGLILAMFLAWAISMLADVRSPDRFDDPKGKTITVTSTD